MAGSVGFEPTASGFGDRRSSQLELRACIKITLSLSLKSSKSFPDLVGFDDLVGFNDFDDPTESNNYLVSL